MKKKNGQFINSKERLWSISMQINVTSAQWVGFICLTKTIDIHIHDVKLVHAV